MNRRAVLASTGALGIVSLTGCLGTIGLDEHSSEPAGVEQRVLDDTGYEQSAVEEIITEEDVSYLSYDETVTVKNHLTEHEKVVDMGPLGSQRGAMFLLLTTPQVNILGREFNPVKDMDTEELVGLVEDNYGNLRNISHRTDDDITVLNQDTIQSTFDAETQLNGADVDVNLHITEAVESGDDLLVAIGVYPVQIQSQEEGNIMTLMGSVIESVEEPTDEDSAAETDDEENSDG